MEIFPRLGRNLIDLERLNGMNFSALCRNLVRFGPAIPEIVMLELITFVAILQNSTYNAKYPRVSWTSFHQIYRIGGHMGGND